VSSHVLTPARVHRWKVMIVERMFDCKEGLIPYFVSGIWYLVSVRYPDSWSSPLAKEHHT